MRNRAVNRNLLFIMGTDVLLIVTALLSAYLVRFDFDIPGRFRPLILRTIPLALGVKVVVFYYMGLYRGMWRYTSIADLFSIIKAASLSTLLIIGFLLLSTRFVGFSRSVVIVDWCFTIILISSFRLLIRIVFVHLTEKKSLADTIRKVWILLKGKNPGKNNLLIIGAGDCGEKIYREIRDNLDLKYNIVGFIDDDRNKIGKKIHGISVLGPIDNIAYIAQKLEAQELLIAISSATSRQMRSIVASCKQSGLPFKTVPGMGELINGRVTVNAIREVDYRDLLGRDVVELDENEIGAYLEGRVVLVTGAGGSIGSELCRQICRFRPEKIVLFEKAESPLFYIELELKNKFQNIHIVPLLSDIQNRCHLEKAFDDYQPAVVFHAAAYKHVPMLEIQPWRAIENNILGTCNVIDAAQRFKVDRFVFVSTDKAVRPANVMGASKRVAEMLVQGCCNNDSVDSRYMVVRFGNVVGSIGSVVPLFKEQIKNGGPVTVTHPEVTRFFMTIPEACQLILQAGAMGGRDSVYTYLLDMGTPVKIVDMARDLIRLSGFEPDVDIKIEFVGLRSGEKLYEELITEGEGIVPTDHDQILVLKGECFPRKELYNKVAALIQCARAQDGDIIKNVLRDIIPEYKHKKN
ncbi:MAG: polysaccharide biosynthesis protein [Deltaproteobacteria bacterium]|nr:MAG: polysaccharide biosynthesis protein [Deltaproteobacteria bacterium]